MRKLAAGNWKMNGTAADLAEVTALIGAHAAPKCDVLLCPPATLIERMSRMAYGSALRIGGQNCHAAPSGAHTGDISAAMLRDAGASHVILGHSERRADYAETSAQVRTKAQVALAAGLIAIVCVGETEAQRNDGGTIQVIADQLAASIPDAAIPETVVVAYEPIWAIGTGRTPTLPEIAEVHADIRARLAARFGAAAPSFRLLYGGSVKPGNAAEIFALPNVDGALVGGASLKAVDFGGIINALSQA